jgi:hypothetical protein
MVDELIRYTLLCAWVGLIDAWDAAASTRRAKA